MSATSADSNSPSSYSSEGSRDDAADLAKRAGLDYRVVPIQPMVDAFLANMTLSGLAVENLQARVRGVIASRTVAAVMFCDSESTSAITGLAPLATTALAEAMNVRHVTITSSPTPISSA